MTDYFDLNWNSRQLGLAILVWALIAFAMTGCEERPPGFYEHQDDGFSLVLPEGWSMLENTGGASVVLWRGERNEKAPTVTVVTVDVPPEATNALFADLNFRDAAASAEYFFIRDEPIVLDGDSLVSRVYVYRAGTQLRQAILASIVTDEQNDKKGYVLLCSSSTEKYQGDREHYLEILQSFRRE